MPQDLKFGSTDSFVFASGTTPMQAMEIHKVVAKCVPETNLLAGQNEKWHYGEQFGFNYAELNSEDPIQAALKDVVISREARIARITSASMESGGAISFSFLEPLPFVLIVLGAVGAGIAGEIGKDIWSGVKAGIKWLWRRRRNEGPSELAQLFKDLGKLYHRDQTGYYPLVLLVFQSVRLTFVVEPELPKKAVSQAELLVMRPKRKLMDIPLRWNRNRNKWIPIKEPFHSEQGIQELVREINR